MKQGQKLTTKDGYQVLLYPLPVLNITQTSSPSSLSHCCGNPFDAVGQTAGAVLYAPADCELYYENSNSLGHSCSFCTTKIVQGASGKGRYCFQFTHGRLLGNGKTYKQGDPIYTTGTLGMVTGDHVHVDQAKGVNVPMISSGKICSYGNTCYMLQNSMKANDVFYINGTTIINSAGLDFKTFQGGNATEGTGGNGLSWIIPVMPSNPLSTSRSLTESEMENNAKCFYGYMNVKYGWSLNAVCGMLGNIQSESTINPNRWQGDYQGYNPVNTEGFGLVQWTPYTNITEWMKKRGTWGKYETYGDEECEKIQEEKQTGQQWIATNAYPMSFDDFATSKQDAGYLALAFLANYERPYDPYQPIRATQARNWYNKLKNYKPVIPDGEGTGNPPEVKKTKWIYYMKRKL